jgi:hypothetical protein
VLRPTAGSIPLLLYGFVSSRDDDDVSFLSRLIEVVGDDDGNWQLELVNATCRSCTGGVCFQFLFVCFPYITLLLGCWRGLVSDVWVGYPADVL